jgi:uncharacterized protein YcbK (DUF882 family)
MSSVVPLSRRSFLKFGTFAAVAGPQLLKAAGSVDATPDRSLSFYNLHTSEKLKVVYWADGGYVPESLTQINHLLRDHRNGKIHEIDPRLLDLLCQVHTKLEATESFHLVSGYRSPETNAMLHSHSDGVAQHSLHMDGMATDVIVPGRSLEALRSAALSMKAGGVGYYPSQFVHIDVGRVRRW